MNPLLQVDNLEVAFDTKDGLVRAVNGISYSVNEGDTLGIVGESGSGKSVSVMSMLRLLPEPPARIVGGRVLFDDRDLLKMKPQQMYQVRGNQIAIVELLERVGIPHAAERLRDYPHQFSGGMRQRVMIAIAISCNPRLLIADEPTTALDVTIQAQIVDLVKELQRELGIAVIWITHDLGVIARLAKRVLVMYGGKIVEQGPIKRVFKAPAHPYTIGLLTSRPGIDIDRSQALPYIEGAPPDMIRLPVGCPFTPRCGFRSDRCGQELPPPVEVSAGHLAACWHIDAVRDHVATLSTPSAISLQPR
jgi:oligopeptide transport system ATP-binding protein